MTYENYSQPIELPERLVSSRHVGGIPAETLPWTQEEPGKLVGVTELQFPDGVAYIASAGIPRLNKITATIQGRDRPPEDSPYTTLDEYFLRAASLEANGEWRKSDRIQGLHGSAEDFSGFSLRDYREGNTPNARRIYYAIRPLGEAALKPLDGNSALSASAPLLVRLAISDKQHQLKVLHQLTGNSRKHLKDKGAGAQ